MNIFKKKVDPKEALRTSKREMSVATRGVEREIGSLQMEEKKLVAEIKKTAKTGNEAMYAGTSISAGMKGASKAMAAMNKQMEPTKQIKVMREFQKQSNQLDMTLEMMSDAIDETLDKDEAEEETEELTNQVLDEIGVDVASQLSSAPKGRIAASNRKAESNQARLQVDVYTGKIKNSTEALRTSKREMSVATRGVEREIGSLQMEEKKLVAEIKKTAKTGNEAMYAGTSISAGMKGASKAMAAMNKQMEPTKQIKVMREFQKQSNQLDMTLEMMSDAIDETLDKDEAEEETEELTNQVLDEIGVDVASQLSSAPKGRIAASNRKAESNQARNAAPPRNNVEPESSAEVDDLERRLASLRRI
uniref:Charged multivesicular body protein 2a n=2 Tax=Oryza TaxID=4527 RepID=A0A0D3FLM4_9ORYZ